MQKFKAKGDPKWLPKNLGANLFDQDFVYLIETLILFRGHDGGVSNVVRDAYQHYEDMEFGSETRTIDDPERHIKLISMTGKKVR